MTWNHKVIRKQDGRGEYYYEIHEVYYEKDGLSWISAPRTPLGDTLDDLKEILERMLKACDKPVMVEDGCTLKEVG